MAKILLLTSVPAKFEIIQNRTASLHQFQIQYHWIRALEALGHRVRVWRYSDPVGLDARRIAPISEMVRTKFGRVYSKYRLIKSKKYKHFPDNLIRELELSKFISQFQPDFIFMTGGCSELLGNFLEIDCIAKVLFHGVDPNLSATQFELDNLDKFDLVVVNDPSHKKAWQKLKAHRSIALPYAGIDPITHTNLHLKRKNRLLFVGTLFPERQAELRQISRHIPIDIYGQLIGTNSLNPSLKPNYKGEAWGNDLIRLYNSYDYVLNLVPDHMPIGGNMRTFEIPGCGAIECVNRVPTSWYTPGKDLIVFDSPQELVVKIDELEARPKLKSKIQSNGWLVTHSQHTYEQRFKAIFDML